MSVVSINVFKSLKDQGLPLEIERNLTSANSSTLEVKARRLLTVSYRGKEYNVPVYVVANLNERAIAGIDMINTLGVCYDPKTKAFISEITDEFSKVTTARAIHFDPFEAVTVKCTVSKWNDTDTLATVSCHSPQYPSIFAAPSVNTVFEEGKVFVVLKNCSPTSLLLPRGTMIGDATPVASVHAIDQEQLFKTNVKPPPPLKQGNREHFISKVNLNVPIHYHDAFVKLLLANHDVFSKTPSDIGRATHFEHTIMLKEFDPVFRKQFRIPDAHREALETQVQEWLDMGIIEPCHSRYNAPIFVVPKKGGKIRFVLDYRALNDASHDDRYCMKDVNECIGDIGKAKSNIFSTLDLTHGSWQLPLRDKCRPYTAFTVPGLGQYQYKVLSMGLKGGPGSFQRMMELTTKGLKNVIVYIDDLLVHSNNYELHLEILESLFTRLRHFKIKLNLEKCVFGSNSVAYLGYRLTPQGIIPGADKLKAIREAKPPATLSQVRAFLGLCNFFRAHVPRYSVVSAPLQYLTTKEAHYRGPNLPPDALASFEALKDALINHPVLQYPKEDLPFELYTDASIGSLEYGGGYGAVLTQPDKFGKNNVLAYASRGLKSYEKNYQPFVAEMMAAVWAMNHFSNYLKGRHFTLYTDHKLLEKLSKVHTRTYNRLQTEMMKFSFDIKYKPGKEMPADFLSRNIPAESSPPQEEVFAIDFDTADIRIAQKQDPFCQTLNSFLARGVLPEDNAQATLVKRIAPLIFEKSGILFRNNTDPATDQTVALLILPKVLVPDAVHRAHGSLLTGHGGVEKTKRRLFMCYYWPNMLADIKQLLAECPRCQLTSKKSKSHDVLHPLPQCSKPNQRIHMDLFGPLKTPTKAKAYILCMTDAFSKYVEAVVASDKTANHIAQL
ncbi:MAG: reverse transcriptase domain-containing protein, partial [Actinomycetota bacterium]